MSRKRKIEGPNDGEKAVSKRLRIENQADVKAKDQDPCFFSSLPLEILTHHILKFFDFRGCLTLAVVCKHWQHAVEKSHLPKQFSITESMDLEYASTVLSKYKIATLVIDLSISFTKLRDILDVSPFTTTLVLCPNNQYDTEDLQTWDYPTRTTSLEFKQITTLSMQELCDSKYFPNVTKLKLHNLKVLYYSPSWKERKRYSNVKELEITVSSSLRFDFGLVKELFPNVDKVYVNYDCKRNKKRLEEYWRRMEEIGWSIGVQIICRNPHLSNRADVFSLTSTSYIEFFNGFGMTPLQKFLRGRTGICSAFERCQDQFWKYTSKQYEKDLCLREPQFNFPTRSPQFGVDVAETVFNLPKSEVSCEAVMSLLKCGFINPWEALEYDMFSDCPIEYYQTILEHCDIQALNNDGMNLATLSFNRCCFLFWWQLTEAGAAIQSDKYLNDFSRSFLKELSNPKSPLPTQVLARLDQKYLQSLVPHIEEFVFDPRGSVKRKKNLLEEFLRLGVKLDDKQRSLLVCRMSQSCLVEEFSQLLPELGLNEPNDKGNTPLMMSIRNCYGYKLYPQYLSQAKFLLLNGADPNTQTTSQKGEIKCAVFLKNAARTFHKDFSFIALLHAHGADFAVEDERGNTVLNRAVSTYEDVDVASLSKLVSIDKPNHDNCTPLFYVINRRQLRWAAQLIEEGVDVNAVAGPLLQPPLITAIELNDESIVYELLASQKIDIKLRDKSGHSFVHYLLTTAEAGFLGFVLNHELERDGPLFEFLKGQHAEANIEFIKNELNAVLSNPKLAHCKTKLLQIGLTNVIITRALIDVLDIDVNMEDSNGDTMLTLIDVNTDNQAIDFLLEKRAEVDHRNKQNNTALMQVTRKKQMWGRYDYEVIQTKLIEADASVTITNDRGLSPLQLDPSLKEIYSQHCWDKMHNNKDS